jgi:hypothetical protein
MAGTNGMNSWRRRKYASWLVPYADGTLDERRRAELEGCIRRDPVLAADAEAQRRVAGRLRGAVVAEDAGRASETSRLWPEIQARIQPKRRSAIPLVWVGGVCAAACLGWAALWGPFRQTSQPPLRTGLPTVIATESNDQMPGTDLSLAKPHTRAVKIHHTIKIVRHTKEKDSPLTAPIAPAESQDMASAGDHGAMANPPNISAPSPKTAEADGVAARFQTAVGIHDRSSGDETHIDSAQRGVVPAVDAQTPQTNTKTPTRMLHGRRHSRFHHRNIEAVPTTTPVSGQNAVPPGADTPKAVHIPDKPVD